MERKFMLRNRDCSTPSCKWHYLSTIKVFKHCAEEIDDVRGENSVDAEWMAYLGVFRHLRYLNVGGCHRITSSALWAITGMTSLQELDLSRCSKINDAAIKHILSLTNLEKLHVSETGVTAERVKLFASLRALSVLDLGGLPVNDVALNSLQVVIALSFQRRVEGLLQEYLDRLQLNSEKIANNMDDASPTKNVDIDDIADSFVDESVMEKVL